MTDNPNLDSAFADDLKSLINDFLQQFLADQPEDAFEYAAQYFSKKWETAQDQQKQRDEISLTLGCRDNRRRAVFDFTYDVAKLKLPDEKYPKPAEQRERIKLRVKDHIFFVNLDEDVLIRIINSMEPKKVAKGDILIRQGEEGQTFYVVESGTFDAFVQDKNESERVVRTYDNEGYFCDVSLIHDEPSHVTIAATSPGLLLALSRADYKNLVQHSQCMKIDRYMKYISQVPILSVLGEEEKLKICDAMRVTTLGKGDVLYEKGDEAGAVYFVQKGTLKEETDDGEEDISTEGEYLGELALMQEGPRNATVKAMEDCELAFLNVDAFERLLGPCKDLMIEHASTYEDILMKEEGSKAPS